MNGVSIGTTYLNYLTKQALNAAFSSHSNHTVFNNDKGVVHDTKPKVESTLADPEVRYCNNQHA
jgi:hypothetical protein